MQCLDLFHSMITGTIIHENDLFLHIMRLEKSIILCHFRIEIINVFLFIEAWHND